MTWTTGAYICLITVLSMLEGTLRGDGYRIDNPIGIAGLRDVEDLEFLLLPLLPLILMCASSLVFRFRKARREERQQLKWVAAATSFFAAGIIIGDFLELLEGVFPIFLGAIPCRSRWPC